MTFDTATLSRELDALVSAGKDSITRAEREVHVINGIIYAEECVQGHLERLRSTVTRSQVLKGELVEMLSNHRRGHYGGPDVTQLETSITDAIAQIRGYA